jgi:hypothetical protein
MTATGLSRIGQISLNARDIEGAKLPHREVWMAFFGDTEGHTLALMAEPRI